MFCCSVLRVIHSWCLSKCGREDRPNPSRWRRSTEPSRIDQPQTPPETPASFVLNREPWMHSANFNTANKPTNPPRAPPKPQCIPVPCPQPTPDARNGRGEMSRGAGQDLIGILRSDAIMAGSGVCEVFCFMVACFRDARCTMHPFPRPSRCRCRCRCRLQPGQRAVGSGRWAVSGSVRPSLSGILLVGFGRVMVVLAVWLFGRRNWGMTLPRPRIGSQARPRPTPCCSRGCSRPCLCLRVFGTVCLSLPRAPG